MKVPNKLPAKLGISGGSQPLFSGGTVAYNHALAGLPFLEATSELDGGRRRAHRRTAPFRKEQTDQERNPGEQSLAGFWLRSQLSFHGGAGLLYSDPSQDNPFSDVRFYRSMNVDPWTRGTLSLLHATAVVVNGTPKPNVNDMASFTTGDGTACVVCIRDTEIAFLSAPSTFTAKTAPSGSNMKSVTSDGASIFVASEDGLWKAAIPSSPSTALSWTKIYTYSTSSALEIGWVKERIVLGIGQSLYELVPSPAGPPAALPTAFYVAKPTGWGWTSIAETSSAIYAIGSVGSVSSILKFTLDSTGGLVTLTGGTVAATLPGGETAVSAFGYLGDFLAIGTSKGARIARAGDTGLLTYGPLLFETKYPVTDWAGRDRFLWCTYSESTEQNIKLARIDLSVEIETNRFAYATDLSASGDTSAPLNVAFYGGTDQLAFGTTTDIYREDETKFPSSGFLDTARVRYSTLEPKVFRSIRVRGPVLEGSLGISVIDENGAVTPVHVYGIGDSPGMGDLKFPGEPQHDFLSFRFTLNANNALDKSATISGWQIKALPGSPRQRLVFLPLLCFDFEKDKHGQRGGGHRSAIERLTALEEVEATGNVIQWQDLDADTIEDCFIEEIDFERGVAPPHFKGWGGIIHVTLRTI